MGGKKVSTLRSDLPPGQRTLFLRICPPHAPPYWSTTNNMIWRGNREPDGKRQIISRWLVLTFLFSPLLWLHFFPADATIRVGFISAFQECWIKPGKLISLFFWGFNLNLDGRKTAGLNGFGLSWITITNSPFFSRAPKDEVRLRHQGWLLCGAPFSSSQSPETFEDHVAFGDDEFCGNVPAGHSTDATSLQLFCFSTAGPPIARAALWWLSAAGVAAVPLFSFFVSLITVKLMHAGTRLHQIKGHLWRLNTALGDSFHPRPMWKAARCVPHYCEPQSWFSRDTQKYSIHWPSIHHVLCARSWFMNGALWLPCPNDLLLTSSRLFSLRLKRYSAICSRGANMYLSKRQANHKRWQRYYNPKLLLFTLILIILCWYVFWQSFGGG